MIPHLPLLLTLPPSALQHRPALTTCYCHLAQGYSPCHPQADIHNSTPPGESPALPPHPIPILFTKSSLSQTFPSHEPVPSPPGPKAPVNPRLSLHSKLPSPISIYLVPSPPPNYILLLFSVLQPYRPSCGSSNAAGLDPPSSKCLCTHHHGAGISHHLVLSSKVTPISK